MSGSNASRSLSVTGALEASFCVAAAVFLSSVVASGAGRFFDSRSAVFPTALMLAARGCSTKSRYVTIAASAEHSLISQVLLAKIISEPSVDTHTSNYLPDALLPDTR